MWQLFTIGIEREVKGHRRWPITAIMSQHRPIRDRHSKWRSKWQGGAEYSFSFQLFTKKERILFKVFLDTSVFRVGLCSRPCFGIHFVGLFSMGGEPVIREPYVLSMEEDVQNGRVTINGLDIKVNEGLIIEVTGLPNDGEVISRDKMDQVSQLTKFIKETETFYWVDSGIVRESLPQPWNRVAIQVMKYITLEGKFRNLFGYGSPAGPSKGATPRISGVPITKSHLLIGPAPPSLHLASVDLDSNTDEDFESQGRVILASNLKEKEGKKRKPPPQVLSANLAKSSRRSTRLQRKSAEKVNVIVDASSSEEDHKINTAQVKEGRSCNDSIGEGEGSPDDSPHPSEDLLGYLWILNSLSGTLTSTCAYLNFLIVEIMKYLKDAAKGKKD
eukprot:Gb_34980 [translate_table: standard]